MSRPQSASEVRQPYGRQPPPLLASSIPPAGDREGQAFFLLQGLYEKAAVYAARLRIEGPPAPQYMRVAPTRGAVRPTQRPASSPGRCPAAPGANVARMLPVSGGYVHGPQGVGMGRSLPASRGGLGPSSGFAHPPAHGPPRAGTGQSGRAGSPRCGSGSRLREAIREEEGMGRPMHAWGSQSGSGCEEPQPDVHPPTPARASRARPPRTLAPPRFAMRTCSRRPLSSSVARATFRSFVPLRLRAYPPVGLSLLA